MLKIARQKEDFNKQDVLSVPKKSNAPRSGKQNVNYCLKRITVALQLLKCVSEKNYILSDLDPFLYPEQTMVLFSKQIGNQSGVIHGFDKKFFFSKGGIQLV